MGLVRLGVPLFLLALFVWKARRSPIYLLGVPFLQVMGVSVLLERLRILDMGRRYGLQVPIVVTLVVVWAVCLAMPSGGEDRRREQPRRPGSLCCPKRCPCFSFWR